MKAKTNLFSSKYIELDAIECIKDHDLYTFATYLHDYNTSFATKLSFANLLTHCIRHKFDNGLYILLLNNPLYAKMSEKTWKPYLYNKYGNVEVPNNISKISQSIQNKDYNKFFWCAYQFKDKIKDYQEELFLAACNSEHDIAFLYFLFVIKVDVNMYDGQAGIITASKNSDIYLNLLIDRKYNILKYVKQINQKSQELYNIDMYSEYQAKRNSRSNTERIQEMQYQLEKHIDSIEASIYGNLLQSDIPNADVYMNELLNQLNSFKKIKDKIISNILNN